MQQQPCDIVWPRAEGSALLAGRVREAVLFHALMRRDLSSAVENSTSRKNHHEPSTSEARGRQGPFGFHDDGSAGSAGIASSTSPSHRLAGPSPLRQLRIISVTLRCVATEINSP